MTHLRTSRLWGEWGWGGGVGIVAVVAESRFQIRTMWLPNVSSYLIPSNPISWFKRLDTISDSSVLKGASTQVSPLIALH